MGSPRESKQLWPRNISCPALTVGLQETEPVGYFVPTVLIHKGFTVRIYLNDHGPPHVHVWRGDGWVLIELPRASARVRAIKAIGMRETDIVRALRIVESHADALAAAWKEIHGS